MFGLGTIDVAIGMVLIFSLLSLIATSAREMIEAKLQFRAAALERGIRELLEDREGKSVTKFLYDHPMVASLFRGIYDPRTIHTKVRAPEGVDPASLPWPRLKLGTKLPAYIPSRNFALALMDIACAGGKSSGSTATMLDWDELHAGVKNFPEGRLKLALMNALSYANKDIGQVRVNLENWFDSGMDRVSGWYRKRTQLILLIIGLTMAISLNVNTIRMATALQNDDAVRAVIVARAETISNRVKAAALTDTADFDKALGCSDPARSCAEQQLQSIPFPIGWHGPVIWAWQPGFSWPGLLGQCLGWLLTALAISLGAPFWFDMLNRLMVIRSTVKPHEKSREEASEDRQRKDNLLKLQIERAP